MFLSTVDVVTTGNGAKLSNIVVVTSTVAIVVTTRNGAKLPNIVVITSSGAKRQIKYYFERRNDTCQRSTPNAVWNMPSVQGSLHSHGSSPF
jgi:hypothetical protein